MNNVNFAVVLAVVVGIVAVRVVLYSPAALRRAAAELIRRAAAIEAADAARLKAGDAAYKEACAYLNIKVPPSTTGCPVPMEAKDATE